MLSFSRFTHPTYIIPKTEKEDFMPMPNVGDPVPDVGFTGADRKEYKLREFTGKQNVVVAFYARAFTGG